MMQRTTSDIEQDALLFELKKKLNVADDRSLFAEQWFASDSFFDQLYSKPIQSLSRKHWTPLAVAKEVSMFLGLDKGVRVLDIGSGVGKFALAASFYTPNALYTGIEQRKYLIEHANMAKEIIGLPNVSFIHGDFTQLDFGEYDNFYFYNSFFENLAGTEKIDEHIAYSNGLYDYYNRQLFNKLRQTRPGTRLATFHSLEEEVPPEFYVVGTAKNGLLKYWIKL